MGRNGIMGQFQGFDAFGKASDSLLSNHSPGSLPNFEYATSAEKYGLILGIDYGRCQDKN